MTSRSYCAFSAFVFALVAAAHLLRAVAGWPVVLGDWPAPVAVSWVVGAGAAALSVWGFRQLPRTGA